MLNILAITGPIYLVLAIGYFAGRIGLFSGPDMRLSGRVAALRTHNLLATEKVRENVLTEHRALIAAFAKGDLERAEDILAEHVLKMRICYRTQSGREPAVEPA